MAVHTAIYCGPMEQTMESPPSDMPEPPRIEKKPSVVFEAPDLARPGEMVSDAEIQFFVDNGFLVKKRLIDRATVEKALRKTWAYLRRQVPMAGGATAPSRRESTTWLSQVGTDAATGRVRSLPGPSAHRLRGSRGQAA